MKLPSFSDERFLDPNLKYEEFGLVKSTSAIIDYWQITLTIGLFNTMVTFDKINSASNESSYKIYYRKGIPYHASGRYDTTTSSILMRPAEVIEHLMRSSPELAEWLLWNRLC